MDLRKITKEQQDSLLKQYAPSEWVTWPANRKLVAAGQVLCLVDGINPGPIDGLPGPQTKYAFDVHSSREAGDDTLDKWRDLEDQPVPDYTGRQKMWPRQSYYEMVDVFGPVGTNQTRVAVPYPLKLAWDLRTVITRMACHKLVADAAQWVLEEALKEYGENGIKELRLDLFGGSLNVRRIRGGSSWSTHAWGIAFDFDPERNALRMNHTRATFARKEYEYWFKLWEEVGALSLGRARDYDWMHTQFARL